MVADIYRILALIPWYDPTQQRAKPTAQSQSKSDLSITYHVWKPNNAAYKKSDPGPPDFRVAVLDARESQVPTLQQLDALLASLPYQPPQQGAPLYAKLRNGYKNVILAVVDQGVTSYLRFADAAFGKEKLYDRAAGPSRGKRGGGGGRGRGRGR